LVNHDELISISLHRGAGKLHLAIVELKAYFLQKDRTIIAPAIPKITDEFNSIDDIGWYGSAYMLTCACFNPLFGRIFQLYSTKWVFLISIVIFEAGSALCGAAPNSTAFIIGRAVAGLGAAGVFTGGMVVMLPLVPLRKRPVFTSTFGMLFGVSSILGPIIGGAFTDRA
jgi:MFS family permease